MTVHGHRLDVLATLGADLDVARPALASGASYHVIDGPGGGAERRPILHTVEDARGRIVAARDLDHPDWAAMGLAGPITLPVIIGGPT